MIADTTVRQIQIPFQVQTDSALESTTVLLRRFLLAPLEQHLSVARSSSSFSTCTCSSTWAETAGQNPQVYSAETPLKFSQSLLDVLQNTAMQGHHLKRKLPVQLTKVKETEHKLLEISCLFY